MLFALITIPFVLTHFTLHSHFFLLSIEFNRFFHVFFLSLSCSSLGVRPFSFSFLSVALLHFVDFSFSMVLNMFDPFVISFVEITFSARQPFFCIFRKLSAAKRSFVLPNKKQIIVFKNNCIRRASRAEKRPELNKNRWKRKPLVTCVKYAIYE